MLSGLMPIVLERLSVLAFAASGRFCAGFQFPRFEAQASAMRRVARSASPA
jgi:hypothetical protein